MLLGIRLLLPTTQPPKPALVGITSLSHPHDHPNLSLWASDLQRPPGTSGRAASTCFSPDPQAHRTETHTTGTQDTSGSSGPSCKASTSLSSPLTPRGAPQTGRAPGDAEAFYLKPGEGGELGGRGAAARVPGTGSFLVLQGGHSGGAARGPPWCLGAPCPAEEGAGQHARTGEGECAPSAAAGGMGPSGSSGQAKRDLPLGRLQAPSPRVGV